MTFKILSIDGGGIRGIIPGQILVSLEEKIQKKSGDHNARIGDYFDMVSGTSTGAILAAAYVCPTDSKNSTARFSAQDAVNFYLDEGDEIFDVGFWRSLITFNSLNDEKFSADELNRVLLDAFGDIKLSELIKPTCFISYDVRKRKPIIFTQHDSIAKGNDFLVRDLLRGSSAAPTYFEAARIYSLAPNRKKHVLVDGGMVANDPTLCAYSEAINFKGVNGIKDMMIFSLGTGKELRSYSYGEIKDWGPLGWAKPSIDIALEGGPQMTEFHMNQIASTVKKSNLFRLQPKLYGADTALDNATTENLSALKESGKRNAIENDTMLERIADFLVNNSE